MYELYTGIPVPKVVKPVEEKYPFLKMTRPDMPFFVPLNGREVRTVQGTLNSAVQSLKRQEKMPEDWRFTMPHVPANKNPLGVPAIGVWRVMPETCTGPEKVNEKPTIKPEPKPAPKPAPKVVITKQETDALRKATIPTPDEALPYEAAARKINPDEYHNIGNLVRIWFRRSGKTAGELVQMSGIAAGDLQSMIENRKPIPRATLLKIMVCVGARTVEEFMEADQ